MRTDAEGNSQRYKSVSIVRWRKEPSVLVHQRRKEKRCRRAPSQEREREMCAHGWIVSVTCMRNYIYIMHPPMYMCTVVAVNKQIQHGVAALKEATEEADYI
jgi:hypothetical protein